MSERTKNSAKTSRLRTLIDREGLTNQSFADKMCDALGDDPLDRHSFKVDLVNKVSSGEAPLMLERAMQISNVFNVSLDWLYERSEDMNDDAGLVLLYLDKFFRIAPGDDGTHDFVIEMDDNVKKFLINIMEAKKAKKQLNINDTVYDLLIDGLKKDFNDKHKSKEETKYERYQLYTRNLYTPARVSTGGSHNVDGGF